MNAQHIIDSAREHRDHLYDDVDSARWPYHIQLLETKIRELCYIYNNVAGELRNIQRELGSK